MSCNLNFIQGIVSLTNLFALIQITLRDRIFLFLIFNSFILNISVIWIQNFFNFLNSFLFLNTSIIIDINIFWRYCLSDRLCELWHFWQWLLNCHFFMTRGIYRSWWCRCWRRRSWNWCWWWSRRRSRSWLRWLGWHWSWCYLKLQTFLFFFLLL